MKHYYNILTLTNQCNFYQNYTKKKRGQNMATYQFYAELEDYKPKLWRIFFS